MSSLLFALVVAVLAFGAGLLGLKLHDWLPEKHAPDRSREMIGAMTGMLSLLLAIVLGTLVGAAYSGYATHKTEMETMNARALQLDSALASFGPEGQMGRDGLKKAITQSYNKIWGGERPDFSGLDLKSFVIGFRVLDQYLGSLTPTTDVQKQALATANAAAAQLELTQILTNLQLASGVNWPMLTIVMCWSLLLFCGYGLVSPVNATVVVSMALGAIAVGSAVFLIIELTNPYAGLIKLSPGAIVETINALGS
ncbi:MAG TPA: hypothetical protein VEH77_10350 [Roseiarcus sp.]|nr:hypothetical protein [Roseiarcus sp.]